MGQLGLERVDFGRKLFDDLLAAAARLIELVDELLERRTTGARARQRRVIVNVSGETGIMVTNPPFLSSCTGPAKSAEIRLSRILANEFALQNIRVNCVVPGFVNTPERFAQWERELAKRQLPDEEAEKMREQWSLNQASRNTRWGSPEELANLIVFALSDAASFVNGAVLVADNAMDKS